MNSRLHIIALLRAVALLLLLSLFLTGCVKDNSVENTPEKEGSARVTFVLSAKGDIKENNNQTRALDDDDETEIRNVTILCFKNGYYFYRATHNELVVNNAFSVTLLVGDYDILVIANMNQQIPALSTSDSKQDVKNKLEYLIKGSVKQPYKWIANTTHQDYKPMPMGSNFESVSIQGNPAQNHINIKLYRSVAKINVRLDSHINNFQLNSVYLYNVNIKGRVCPNFDEQGGIESANIPIQDKIVAPVEYKFLERDHFDNEIYLFEALNHNDFGERLSDDLQTCLVVGGIYGDDPNNNYYRIDLTTGSGSSLQYYDIERNNIYQINILNVSGSGLPTEDDAFNAGPVNMDVNVVEWHDGGIVNVETDGIYSLGVPQKSYGLPYNKKEENVITFKSDYTSEITVVASASNTDPTQTEEVSEWLSNVTLNIGETRRGVTEYEVSYDVSANTEHNPRTAYFHITAGVIDMVVKVVQGRVVS